MSSSILNILPKPAYNSKHTVVVKNQFSENKKKEQREGFANLNIDSYINTPKFARFANPAQKTEDVFIRPCGMRGPCNCEKKCNCARQNPKYMSLTATLPEEMSNEISVMEPESKEMVSTARPLTTNLYIGSITVVALFIAYRMIKKTV